MKKIRLTLLSGLMLSALAFASCTKKADVTNTQTTAVSAVKKTTVASMSAGEMHNFFLSEYKRRFGLPKVSTGVTTMADMKQIYTRLTQIAIDNGIVITEDQDRFTNEQFDNFVASGYFNTDGTLKSMHEVAALTFNSIQNTELRDALNDIDVHSGEPDLLGYANQKISGLSGLNAADQETANNYISVLGSSIQFWQAEPIKYPMGLGDIGNADASGIAYGWGQALHGWYYIISLVGMPAYHCAARSIAAIN